MTTERDIGQYESRTTEDCEACGGRGITDEFLAGPQGPCPICHGRGIRKMQPEEVDPEALCMHDGCDKRATTFEPVETHWHDFIWCDEHATGKVTVPLKAEVKGEQ